MPSRKSAEEERRGQMMNTKVENPIRLDDIFEAQEYMPRRYARKAQFECKFVGDEALEHCRHVWDIPSGVEHDAIKDDLRLHIFLDCSEKDAINVRGVPSLNGEVLHNDSISARISEGQDSWYPIKVNFRRENSYIDSVEGLLLIAELHTVVSQIVANIVGDLKEARA